MKTDAIQLRFNQILLVALIPLALLSGQFWLIAVLFALMVSQHLGFDGLVWLKQTARIKPQILNEDPVAHRFARSVGAIFLAVASLAFIAGFAALGITLSLMVAALALLNLTTKICVGCILYYQFRMVRYRFSGR